MDQVINIIIQMRKEMIGNFEKNGSFAHYYFICSTARYNAFGNILRTDETKEFILTKQHNIPYILHSFYNINYTKEIFNNNNYNQSEWDNIEYRKKYIKYYFENYSISTEEECLKYIIGKTEKKMTLGNHKLK